MARNTPNPADGSKPAAAKRITIADAFRFILQAPPPTAETRAQQRMTLLSSLAYEAEIEAKHQALQHFWTANRLPGKVETILPSPHPRGYQSTSNRQLLSQPGKQFLLQPWEKNPTGKRFFQPSPLEPARHARVYELLAEKLNQGSYASVARKLKFITIRGNERESSVIFNMVELDSQLVRKLKALAGHIQSLQADIISVFIHAQPVSPGAYLHYFTAPEQARYKNLFGPEKLFVKIGDYKFGYYPSSFSPLNIAIVPGVLKLAGELLQPSGEQRLLDLYCGYGLFSCPLADGFREVIGVDPGTFTIQAAEANRPFFPGKHKLSFLNRGIRPALFRNQLPDPQTLPESVLLAPPWSGTGSGVIKAIAERRPKRVLHLVRDVNDLPARLGEWRSCGYRMQRVMPLDMYPGTMDMELLVVLEATMTD